MDQKMHKVAASPLSPSSQAAGKWTLRSSDGQLIDLLRGQAFLKIDTLARGLGVTATAVRQRLERLMEAGLVSRSRADDVLPESHSRRPRGRPSHVYSLTEKGRRTQGDNFRDLALVLWQEIRSVQNPEIRRGLIARIGSAMANQYRTAVTGDTAQERFESVARLLRDRQIPCDVSPAAQSAGSSNLAVLTSHSCPYPELPDIDRGICSAERLMLQELVGTAVQLSECRLDGGSCCRFTAAGAADSQAVIPATLPQP